MSTAVNIMAVMPMMMMIIMNYELLYLIFH